MPVIVKISIYKSTYPGFFVLLQYSIKRMSLLRSLKSPGRLNIKWICVIIAGSLLSGVERF